jgi:hypothetical protein
MPGRDAYLDGLLEIFGGGGRMVSPKLSRLRPIAMGQEPEAGREEGAGKEAIGSGRAGPGKARSANASAIYEARYAVREKVGDPLAFVPKKKSRAGRLSFPIRWCIRHVSGGSRAYRVHTETRSFRTSRHELFVNLLILLVPTEGFEPPTP